MDSSVETRVSIPATEGSIDEVDIPVILVPAACRGVCEGCTEPGILEGPISVLALQPATAEAFSPAVDFPVANMPVVVNAGVEGGSGPDIVEPLEEAHVHHISEEKPQDVANAVPPSLFFPALMGGSGGPCDPHICAICLDRIQLAETSQIKGCEHSYCVTCILRWALYKTNPWCPQCRLPFTELYVYRALDGSMNDYLVEESVCLLLRASWFKGMPSFTQVEEPDDYYEEDDCFDEYYFKSNVRIGNRRWGDNGYVRAGRREARPIGVRHLAAAVAQADEAGSSSFRPGKNKEKVPPKEATGRRAKRAQKREALDKLQAQQRSVR